VFSVRNPAAGSDRQEDKGKRKEGKGGFDPARQILSSFLE